MEPPFAPGERVAARRQRWWVTSVRGAGACAALTLEAIDPASREPRTLIHPFDRFTRLRRHLRVRPSRPAHALQVLAPILQRRRPRWFVPTGVVGAPIAPLPHQFVAAIALVRGIASRVCVMDAVGTGKTVQAAIAIAELLGRGIAARVLVLVPAGLRHQWAAELARLRVAARVLDAHGRADATNALPADVSPWALPGVTIASIDVVKRPDTLSGLDGLTWDALVADEAHGAASHTERHDAVDGLARRARHVLLLTATPHDGDDRRFKRLITLGGTDPLLVVRHRAARPPRRVHHLAIAPTSDELAALAALARYREAVARCGPTPRLIANHLVCEVLARRAAASMLALARTAARRRDALSLPAFDQPLLFALPAGLPDAPANGDDDDDALGRVLAAPGALDVRHERALLGIVHSAALRAARADTLVSAVERIVRRAAEPVIVFAEHRDALVSLVAALARTTRVEVLHGGCSPAERARALASFIAGSAQALLATDTAAEGLNLHQRCRLVVHLDTPWTATRLAQREGRVDRHGQRRRVHAWRLARRGFEPATLFARHQAREGAADAALAGFGRVPVLVDGDEVTPLPGLLADAEEAAACVASLRTAPHGRASWRAKAPGRVARQVRTRLVVIDRATLPGTLRHASALLVMSVAVSVSPQVAESLDLVVQVPHEVHRSSAARLARHWRHCLGAIGPALLAHAESATREAAAGLADAEHRRRATCDARHLVVQEGLRTPLAAHFVQRSLFDTAPTTPALDVEAPAAPWPAPRLGPRVEAVTRVSIDLPLLLVASGLDDASTTA